MDSKYKIHYDIGSQGEYWYNLMEFKERRGHVISGWTVVKTYKDETEANKALEHLRKNEVAQ